jgi:hypothetical protein
MVRGDVAVCPLRGRWDMLEGILEGIVWNIEGLKIKKGVLRASFDNLAGHSGLVRNKFDTN